MKEIAEAAESRQSPHPRCVGARKKRSSREEIAVTREEARIPDVSEPGNRSQEVGARKLEPGSRSQEEAQQQRRNSGKEKSPHPRCVGARKKRSSREEIAVTREEAPIPDILEPGRSAAARSCVSFVEIEVCEDTTWSIDMALSLLGSSRGRPSRRTEIGKKRMNLIVVKGDVQCY
jgi:hypothetical protein